LKFTLAGISIIIFLFVLNDLIAVLLITIVLIIEELIGALSSIFYFSGLKTTLENEIKSH